MATNNHLIHNISATLQLQCTCGKQLLPISQECRASSKYTNMPPQ